MNRKHADGFSLVEVVAGLVIMAGVMSATLISFASHSRATRMAIERADAVLIADDLMNRLMSRRSGFPISESGTFPGTLTGHGVWRWRTGVIAAGTCLGIDTQTVRFEMRRGDGSRLLHIDVLRPMNAPEESE